MAVLAAVLLLCVVGAGTSPLRTYDQRQQGELNIHAQLDNIVIVLVPSSNFDLLGLKGINRFGQKPSKDEILQFLQKPQKNDIDRYEIVKDENENDIKDAPASVSEDVPIVQQSDKHSEKDEEVVATVEEMKPETTEKATETKKSDVSEVGPIKEHSTVSESIKELVLKVSASEKLKNEAQANKEMQLPIPSKDLEIKPEEPLKIHNEHSKPDVDKELEAKKHTSEDIAAKNKEPSSKTEASADSKTSLTKKENDATPETPVKKLTLKDLIKPIAAKEEEERQSPAKIPEEPVTAKKTSSLVEGSRREKVIRYKPENKWAPGLVDMLAAPRAKTSAKDLEERQRFAALCAPGTWDTELKTCIMPGETRSRHELARFLEAMRFGIAIPSSKQ
ncbi:neurofilament medium polypeptide-like isoform X3 [Macrosteles quadrilineatus]|uniref:neurofilament medium polypeptide-like isoform X1 n=1 Tax=Macrosteles quadrilineatus TaxID=74068 RepID=UPI0023E22774|nr:neurofilament medium polypeptide-like isoform X1 [Macrosteles quadrilineatus]XP_054262742.1 neurofilament medium polypeptide-like isoform X3 [Macrosteles quadrilineatus]